MLIDDNPDDNFFHERVIKKNDFADTVIVMTTAKEALQYLQSRDTSRDALPDLIFLDINMPGMNGWDFLQDYSALEKHLQSRLVVIMLTTSENTDDYKRAIESKIPSSFKTKPLTKQKVDEIIEYYF